VKNQLSTSRSVKKKEEKEKKKKKSEIYLYIFLVISFGELLQVGLLGIFLLSLVYVNSSCRI
jgi:nitrate reductase NapE component